MPPVLDPKLLTLESYPHQYQQETQFGDMDILGHINNVAIVKYYENARTRFLMECFENTNLFGRGGYSFVLVELTTKFLGETHFPAPLTIGTAIEKIGSSSMRTKQAVFQSGQCVGLCDTTLVLVEKAKPLALPQSLRECVTQYRYA